MQFICYAYQQIDNKCQLKMHNKYILTYVSQCMYRATFVKNNIAEINQITDCTLEPTSV